MTKQPINYDDGQRFHITPPSTSRHQRRTTSSANNIYRHLPVLITVIYVSTSTTSAVIYSFIIYATRFSGLLTRITHMDYLHGLHLHYLGSNSTTADYSRSRTTNYNIICHCLTCPWPYSFINCFTLADLSHRHIIELLM